MDAEVMQARTDTERLSADSRTRKKGKMFEDAESTLGVSLYCSWLPEETVVVR